MEMWGIAFASLIPDVAPGFEGLVTDSEVSMTMLNQPKKLTKWGRKANVALLKVLIKNSTKFIKSIEFVRSHADRRKPFEKLSRKEIGNWAADRAADGDVAAVKTRFPNVIEINSHTLQMLNEVSTDESFFIAHKNGTIRLEPLQELVNSRYAQWYLSERDQHRQKRLAHQFLPPSEPDWIHRTVKHAAKIWGFASKHRSLLTNAREQRLVFDKYWLPWNVAKHLPATDISCPQCGSLTSSLMHVIAECNHEHMHGVRATALSLVEASLINTQISNLPFATKLLDFIKNDTDRYLIYTGLWSLGLRQRFNDMLSGLTAPSNSQLIEWSRILTQTSMDLTICAKQLMGLRLDNAEGGTEPRYNAETVLTSITARRKMSENERPKKKKKDKAAAKRKQKRMAAEEQQVDFARDQAAPAEESRIGAKRAPGYEERKPQVDSTHQHIPPPPISTPATPLDSTHHHILPPLPISTPATSLLTSGRF